MEVQMFTNKGNSNFPKDELVLLFCASFEEGVVISKSGFITFLKKAQSDEVVTCLYSFHKADSSLLLSYPYLSDTLIAKAVLGSLEVH
jgi:hypothetical protein